MRKIIALSLVMLLSLSACAYFQQNSAKSNATPPPKDGVPNQVFYGFPDLPLPKELKYVSEKSFIYETPSFRAGVLFFSGNVDIQSLENYFKLNMAKNGWQHINSFRYKDTVLNYVKGDRTCNIKMSPGSFSSDIEIWIGPADKGSIQKYNEPTK